MWHGKVLFRCDAETTGCVWAGCRQDKIEESVMFAQASLAPMRGLLTHRNRAYDAMLHDVVALLAYEDPLVCARIPQGSPQTGSAAGPRPAEQLCDGTWKPQLGMVKPLADELARFASSMPDGTVKRRGLLRRFCASPRVLQWVA